MFVCPSVGPCVRPSVRLPGHLLVGRYVPLLACNNNTHLQHDQVYLLSFAKDDALTQWMRKLNTAMIIGPGARTSGFREPSAPYMVSKSHRSLTVMWLPPRQPYLNSVHSFQVSLNPPR